MTAPSSSMRDRAYLAWGLMLAANAVVFILVSLWTSPRDGLGVLVILVLCSAWVLSAVLRARGRGPGEGQRQRVTAHPPPSWTSSTSCIRHPSDFPVRGYESESRRSRKEVKKARCLGRAAGRPYRVRSAVPGGCLSGTSAGKSARLLPKEAAGVGG